MVTPWQWSNHICKVPKKANSRLHLLKLLKHLNLPTNDRVTIYSGFVRPTVEYAASVWHPGLNVYENLALERIQKMACRIIVGKDYTTYHEALELCNLQALHGRREQLCLCFFNSFLESECFNTVVGCNLGEIPYTVECYETLTNLPCWNLEQFVTNTVHFCTWLNCIMITALKVISLQFWYSIILWLHWFFVYLCYGWLFCWSVRGA